MKARTGVVSALALLVTTGARGGEPDVRGFKSYVMPAYTIVTHDELAAQRIPTQIAMIDAVLAKVLKGKPGVAGVPTYIVVTPQDLWTDYLQPGVGLDDEYVPGRFANYLLINNCRCEAASVRASVYHQYAHLFLRSQFRGLLPLWFEEGMARIAELTEFQASRAYLGLPPGMYQGWMPLDQLLVIDRSTRNYRSLADTRALKDESWALVYRMFADDAYGKKMYAFLDALGELKSIEEAARSSFGMSVTRLNREVFLYTRGSAVKTLWVNVDLPTPQTLTTGRSMGEVESLEFLAEVMLESGFRSDRLQEVLAAAYRRAPDSPGVHVLRMRLAARNRSDEALAQLLQSIESRLPDPKVARGVGLALFERLRDLNSAGAMLTSGNPLFSTRAMELLDRAILARPDDPEAVWAYAMLAASSKHDLTTALRRVKKVKALAPFNADLAMAEAMVHEARGESPEAIASLNEVKLLSSSPGQRAWVMSRIAALRGDAGARASVQ